jgi:hypothetical protein
MRALLACGTLVIAGLAAGAAEAKSPAAKNSQAAITLPSAASLTRARVTSSTTHIASGVTGSVQSHASTPTGKTVPATLGGRAKYDAKKGAILGGTVMPRRP